MQQDAPQLRFETARLASGPQVHYAEQGDPGGEPILFLHGYTDSWFAFSRLLPLLPNRYRALALDSVATATPSAPTTATPSTTLPPTSWRSWTPSASSRQTVVGHSAGSFIARRVAQIHPERVPRLVLIG